MSKQIQLLKREEIDDKRWNGCVHFAFNSLPFGYTWNLDNVAEHWEGLVYDDYQAVFPLVYKSKMGVSYIYTPQLARQLGLFSLNPIAPALMNRFLEAIPAHYQDVQIDLNAMNGSENEQYKYKQKEYYVLDLEPIHTSLSAAYTDALKNKLIVAAGSNLYIKSGVKPEPVVQLFEDQQNIDEVYRHMLHRLLYKAEHYNVGQSVGAYLGDELVAAAFFMFNKGYMLALIAANTPSGKDLNALEWVIDHMIRTNAGSRKVLDFGQLNNMGVHEGFNAKEVVYWQMSRKKVPWYLQFIK